jgi:hypothetical protein
MLVWGTANPEGMENSYNGYFFKDSDLQQSLSTLTGTPVKIEHKSGKIGQVVSGWINQGKLDLLLDLDENIPEAAIISSFIRQGLCNELSLGYTVQMEASQTGEDIAKQKTIKEVSVVKRGARENCVIHAWVK